MAAITRGVLMQWGPVAFRVHPLNYNKLDHGTESDWAKKEIAGSAIHYEWVGENAEDIDMAGRIFPYHKIGGLPEIEAMEAMRRNGMGHPLIRGDGVKIGWFILVTLHRSHTAIGEDGYGQVIDFQAKFTRGPAPPAEAYFPNMWTSVMQ